MILYKLTSQDMTTHNNFKWELKKPSPLLPPGGKLCSSGFYHAYLSPELAVLLNPIHADYQNPRLFEAEGEVVVTDRDLKVGVKQLTLLVEMPLPVISLDQRTAFAILTAKTIYKEPGFNKWADDWLDNKDRSSAAANAKHRKAFFGAPPSHAAAYAATYAAYAADATDATDATYAAYAADAAARAAGVGSGFDLIVLAKECLKY